VANCTNTTCILLHGLFFMTFKDNKLIVTTPKFAMHKFGERDQGQPNIGPLPASAPDIDWSTSVGLHDNANSPQTFPKSIMQFSSRGTGTGELLPPNNSAYQFQLKLPLPCEIYSFRQDQLAVFNGCAIDPVPKPSGSKSVKQSVMDFCGPVLGNPIALLTGLVYERTPSCTLPSVLSFYAEHHMHCANIKAQQVNAALLAAQGLFTSGADFDLQFKDIDMIPICPPSPNPYGVAPNDELSACELSVGGCFQPLGPNPINCGQFAVNP